MSDLSRRTILVGGIGTMAAIAMGKELKMDQDKQQPPPPLDGALVKDFVGAGHGDLEKVKSMMAEHPTLLNATWDWKNGDFETAIGGAGHMGRRDIAQYLLDNGARMDLFVAAMMGHLEVVRATIEAQPKLLISKGPHGISLMTHAVKGGDGAKAVVEFLKSKGLTE